MDAKAAGNLLLLVGTNTSALGGSHLAMCFGERVFASAEEAALPEIDPHVGARHARAVARVIAEGLARSAHDPSEGGVLVAAAEMAIGGDLGLHVDLLALGGSTLAAAFAETTGRYLLEVRRDDLDAVDAALAGTPYAIVGEFNDSRRLTGADPELDLAIDELVSIWRGTLDW
jgi:phosphoribosylformylglycinamidine synthase